MAKRSSSRKLRGNAEKTGSAVDRAYDMIKGEILGNQLRPGQPVPIERYVRDLRLSRTPVREAALRLEREGLIDIRPRLGTFVAHLDLRSIQDMYRVRRLLEGEAAREAAVRAPEEELRALRDALQRIGPADLHAMSETGYLLHGAIVKYCGNEVLRRMLHSLRDHFTRFRSLSIQIPDKVRSSHQEHLEIVEAMLARSPGKAHDCVHRHFDHAAQTLIENLLRGSAGEASRVTVSFPAN